MGSGRDESCTSYCTRCRGAGADATVKMDKIEKYMTKFKRSVETNPYTVITPATELDELELFLQDNIFALGTSDSTYRTFKFD